LRRSGAVGFEARVSGSSADAELAGFAMMEWRTPKLLAIHLSDLLNYPPSIIALTFERAGAEFLRVGSYPVFARPDLGPPNVFSASLQMPAHNAGSADYDLVSGVLYVDKADTLHATGHFEVRLIGNALHIGRMRRPFGTKTDTVRVVGAFDAKYERRYQDGTFRQWWPNGHPAPMGPAPDYRLNKILTTLKPTHRAIQFPDCMVVPLFGMSAIRAQAVGSPATSRYSSRPTPSGASIRCRR
jgi:hypothetical protein